MEVNGLALTAPPLLAAVLGTVVALYAAGAVWFITGMHRRYDTVTHQPNVSVVVAARDEEDTIQRCLRALMAQDYPEDRFEIIVVDDGSTDRTVARVRALASGSVRLLSTASTCGYSGSKKAALTLGIDAARGDIILTTDADCLVPASWVAAMVRYFADDVGMVIGFSRIGTARHGAPEETGASGAAYPQPRGGSIGQLRRHWREGYEATDFLILMGCIAGSTGHGHPMAASGQNLAYRKALFHEVGGYSGLMHRASGDDVLLLQRVRRHRRWPTVFAADKQAHVVHPAAASTAALLRQRCRWASNAPYQSYMDPGFFAYMLTTYVLSGLLVLSPLLGWGGLLPCFWIITAWTGKIVAEYHVLARASSVFGRSSSCCYFILWTLVQPLHVLYVGTAGGAGVFTWKGQTHRWGRRVDRPGSTR